MTDGGSKPRLPSKKHLKHALHRKQFLDREFTCWGPVLGFSYSFTCLSDPFLDELFTTMDHKFVKYQRISLT